MPRLSRHSKGLERVKWASIALALSALAVLVLIFWVRSPPDSIWACGIIGIISLALIFQGIVQHRRSPEG